MTDADDVCDDIPTQRAVTRVSPSALLIAESSNLGAALVNLTRCLLNTSTDRDPACVGGAVALRRRAVPSPAVRTALMSLLRGFGPFGIRSSNSPSWTDLMTANNTHRFTRLDTGEAASLLPIIQVGFAVAFCNLLVLLKIRIMQPFESSLTPYTPASPPTTSVIDWLRRRQVHGVLPMVSVQRKSLNTLYSHARGWSSASVSDSCQARVPSPSYHTYAARVGAGGMPGDGYHTAEVRIA